MSDEPRITDPIDRAAAERGIHVPDPPSRVTILDLAKYRLGLGDDVTTLTGADFQHAGLAIMGGCMICGATLAAYNGCPTKSGYWACARECAEMMGDEGPWYDVAEANTAIFGADDPGPGRPAAKL